MIKSEFQLNNFSWIDIIKAEDHKLDDLSKLYQLPDRIFENALDPDHLPKFEELTSSTAIYIRIIDPEHEDGVGLGELTTKITIVITNDTVITIHRLDHPFLASLRQRSDLSTLSLKDFLKVILESSIKSFDRHLIKLESRVDAFEDLIFENSKHSHILKEGYFLKRKASALRKVLKFSSEILTALKGRYGITSEDFQSLKEDLDNNIFYAEDALENVTGLLNLHISLAAQKTNEIMRVLTVFSIFFLPINFLAGVYGMNFDYMPELNHPNGYYYVLGTMGLICLLIFTWFYKRGWLKKPE